MRQFVSNPSGRQREANARSPALEGSFKGALYVPLEGASKKGSRYRDMDKVHVDVDIHLAVSSSWGFGSAYGVL